MYYTKRMLDLGFLDRTNVILKITPAVLLHKTVDTEHKETKTPKLILVDSLGEDLDHGV